MANRYINEVRRRQAFFVLSVVISSLLSVAPTRAQSLVADASVSASLPDAPAPQTAALNGTAAINGTVTDTDKASIPGAEVELLGEAGQVFQTVKTAPDGSYRFSSVPAGAYYLHANALGFTQGTSNRLTVSDGQILEAPALVLQIASANTEITVKPIDVVADEQIKAQEKQRAFGVFPMFYTSYVWNAAPLNTKQKFKLATRETFDPMAFVGISIGAGLQQANNSYPGFGQGAEGYAKRWGALFATNRTSDYFSHAIYPTIFHQDPRYFYQGSGTKWSRAKHAIGMAFVARSDSGKHMPNYSAFLASLTSGALSNLYYPADSRGADLIFENAAIGMGGRALQNLVREFISTHITTHVPANGKPATNQP